MSGPMAYEPTGTVTRHEDGTLTATFDPPDAAFVQVSTDLIRQWLAAIPPQPSSGWLAAEPTPVYDALVAEYVDYVLGGEDAS